MWQEPISAARAQFQRWSVSRAVFFFFSLTNLKREYRFDYETAAFVSINKARRAERFPPAPSGGAIDLSPEAGGRTRSVMGEKVRV